MIASWRDFISDSHKDKGKELYNKLKVNKGCSTCANCNHKYHYPSYVIGEECECLAGLECDTVNFTVKNCPEWRGNEE